MQLSSIVESLLIASQSPLSCEELARLVRSRVIEAEEINQRDIEDGKTPTPLEPWLIALGGTTPEAVLEAISELNRAYEDTGRAFTLLERPKGWKIYTRLPFAEFVKQLFPGHKPERMSGPAMETLAIIAYRQPVTKAAIEAVRGVACDGMIQKLLDRDLIRIGGRAELPGRPLLYETTDLFFDHFGIRSIDDLPNASELRHKPLPTAPPSETSHDTEQQLALSAVGKPVASAENANSSSDPQQN